jgi:hypothetical protein
MNRWEEWLAQQFSLGVQFDPMAVMHDPSNWTCETARRWSISRTGPPWRKRATIQRYEPTIRWAHRAAGVLAPCQRELFRLALFFS